MKRDMKLIREILLWAENKASASLETPTLPGYDPTAILFQVKLLKDAGFVDAEDKNGRWAISLLTWAGCEYLDSIR